MLKTMLSVSGQLDFVDEMFLLCPRWLHRDLKSSIRRHVGSLSDPEALDRLMALLYSGRPFGWFWTAIGRKIDRQRLRDELSAAPLTLRNIFVAIMRVHAEGNGKEGIGAKFPAHYSYTETLMDWFPGCRIIHTTRNPKAVYASQAAKYIESTDGVATQAFKRFQQFVHINIQVNWTAVVHRRLQERDNYCLVRYEDVVNDTESELRRVCRFLDVPFVEGMLTPHQYGSSFDTIGKGSGVDKSSLERWRSTLSPRTARLMDALQRSAMRTFGYEERAQTVNIGEP